MFGMNLIYFEYILFIKIVIFIEIYAENKVSILYYEMQNLIIRLFLNS